MLQLYTENILNRLNSHIKLRTGLEKDMVAFANMSDVAMPNNTVTNKVIMSLADLNREETSHDGPQYVEQGRQFVSKNPPVRFDLNILFASYFPNSALEGLKYLSLVIGFFQVNNCIKIQSDYYGQESLSASILNLNQGDRSALWGRIGVHYMPSILYKISTVPVEDMGDKGVMVPKVESIAIDSTRKQS